MKKVSTAAGMAHFHRQALLDQAKRERLAGNGAAYCTTPRRPRLRIGRLIVEFGVRPTGPVARRALPFHGSRYDGPLRYIINMLGNQEGARLRAFSSAYGAMLPPLHGIVELVSGIVFIAMFFASAGATSVMATSVEFSSAEVDPVLARQFPQFGNTLLYVLAMRMAAVFVFTTSNIGRTARILPS